MVAPKLSTRSSTKSIVLAAVALLVLLLLTSLRFGWIGGTTFPQNADGSWRLQHSDTGETPLEGRAGQLLEVDGDRAAIQGACNAMRIDINGQTVSTAEECDPDLMSLDELIERAIRTGGRINNQRQLVFEHGDMTLIYDRDP